MKRCQISCARTCVVSCASSQLA